MEERLERGVQRDDRRLVGPSLGRGLVQIVFNVADLVSPPDFNAVFADDAVSGNTIGGNRAGPEEKPTAAGFCVDELCPKVGDDVIRRL
jgi:hypothetical protein